VAIVCVAQVAWSRAEEEPRAAAAVSVDRDRPNLILISVDTLRADHLGLYGYSKDTDPALQRHLGDGLRFAHAVAPVAVTRPSHASLHTGRHVVDLGMRWNDKRLPEGVPSIAEVLQQAGYETAAVVAAWPVFGEASGLDRGFRSYYDLFNPFLAIHHSVERLTVLELLRFLDVISTTERLATPVTDDALAWLADAPEDRPFFLWLHYFDPHSHYNPPETHARAMGLPEGAPLTSRWLYAKVQGGARKLSEEEEAWVQALYDGEIHYTDSEIGRFLDALEARGQKDRTVILLTADHGEVLTERLADTGKAFIHSEWVDEEEIRIPFVLRGPGIHQGVVRDTIARSVDVLPTLLALAGAPIPEGVKGRDLLSDPATLTPMNPAISINAPRGDGESLVSARAAGFKYTLTLESGVTSLVRVGPEGVGSEELIELEPEVAERFRTALLDVSLVREQAQLSPEDEAKLRALGYIE
jgi:arylsulfatase